MTRSLRRPSSRRPHDDMDDDDDDDDDDDISVVDVTPQRRSQRVVDEAEVNPSSRSVVLRCQ